MINPCSKKVFELINQFDTLFPFSHLNKKHGGKLEKLLMQLVAKVRTQTLSESKTYCRKSIENCEHVWSVKCGSQYRKIQQLVEEINILKKTIYRIRDQLAKTQIQLEISQTEIQNEVAQHLIPTFIFSDEAFTSSAQKKEEGKKELRTTSETISPAAVIASSAAKEKDRDDLTPSPSSEIDSLRLLLTDARKKLNFQKSLNRKLKKERKEARINEDRLIAALSESEARFNTKAASHYCSPTDVSHCDEHITFSGATEPPLLPLFHRFPTSPEPKLINIEPPF